MKIRTVQGAGSRGGIARRLRASSPLPGSWDSSSSCRQCSTCGRRREGASACLLPAAPVIRHEAATLRLVGEPNARTKARANAGRAGGVSGRPEAAESGIAAETHVAKAATRAVLRANMAAELFSAATSSRGLALVRRSWSRKSLPRVRGKSCNHAGVRGPSSVTLLQVCSSHSGASEPAVRLLDRSVARASCSPRRTPATRRARGAWDRVPTGGCGSGGGPPAHGRGRSLLVRPLGGREGRRARRRARQRCRPGGALRRCPGIPLGTAAGAWGRSIAGGMQRHGSRPGVARSGHTAFPAHELVRRFGGMARGRMLTVFVPPCSVFSRAERGLANAGQMLRGRAAQILGSAASAASRATGRCVPAGVSWRLHGLSSLSASLGGA